MNITIETSGLDKLITKIKNTYTKIPTDVQAVNRQFVPITLATLIRHSSGRPGPNIGTGAYNRAYEVKVSENGMAVLADNNSPQSDRLEYGFIGVDSRGRHYLQPPFPHFRPAFEELAPRYGMAIGAVFPIRWSQS